MTDKIFEILGANPMVTIIGTVIVLVVFMFLFKEQIKKYLIKKFNLYTEEELIAFAKRINPVMREKEDFIKSELVHWTKVNK